MIYVYVGLNIQDVEFNAICGNCAVYGLSKQGRININAVSSAYRKLPEIGKHNKILAEYIEKEVNYSKGYFDLHISTHNDVVINKLGQMIHDKLLSNDEVIIYVLNDDNSKIEVESVFDKDGYLVNWPYGFFDYGS